MVKAFLFSILFVLQVFAQQYENPGDQFNKAVNFFESGQLDSALIIFDKLTQISDSDVNLPSRVFRGKILVKQNRNEDALLVFNNLTKTVKDSSLLMEIFLNKALLSFNMQDYYGCAEQLIDIYTKSGTGEYRNYARNILDTLSIQYLSSSDVSVLFDLSRKEIKPLLLLLLGKTYEAENNFSEAKLYYLKLIQDYPSSQEKSEAEDYFYQRKTVTRKIKAEPVIVVLLPESSGGNGGTAINEIREGIKFAVYQHNLAKENKIGLVFRVMDQADINNLKQGILNMNTRCILGPVYSEDVRFVLEKFRGIKIPVISPTATDNDLTSINEFFFQANPNFTIRAKAMAQYIYYVENKRNICVLNAIDGYSPLLASTFSQEFTRIGGKIVINETYKSGSGSVEDQVGKINEVISSIEGIYIPVADKEDIIPVLDALSKNNISITLYGSQDWMLAKGLESYPALNNNLVIESDYFIDFNSEDYNLFNADFKEITGLQAGRNVLYGYDMTKYFLNQLSKVNADPEVIASRMVNGNTVTGFHNNICFDGGRVNKFINIVRYNNGIFELLDKFKSGN